MLVTFEKCLCTNVPSLQLPSEMCWLAFQNSLACSQLLALAICSVEERDGKGLVVDCCADPPFPPGVTGSTSTRWHGASVPCHMMAVCPGLARGRSAFSSGRVKGAGCLPCPVSGNTPLSSLCHLNGMSSSGGEGVTNVLGICRRRGERKAQATVFASVRACWAHLDTKKRVVLSYVCLSISATGNHWNKHCKQQSTVSYDWYS